VNYKPEMNTDKMKIAECKIEKRMKLEIITDGENCPSGSRQKGG
jgi:hypothetical protein